MDSLNHNIACQAHRPAVAELGRSGEPWSPSGGMFDRDGNLWLLEYDSANAVRVRRIARDGGERIFPAKHER